MWEYKHLNMKYLINKLAQFKQWILSIVMVSYLYTIRFFSNLINGTPEFAKKWYCGIYQPNKKRNKIQKWLISESYRMTKYVMFN